MSMISLPNPTDTILGPFTSGSELPSTSLKGLALSNVSAAAFARFSNRETSAVGDGAWFFVEEQG